MNKRIERILAASKSRPDFKQKRHQAEIAADLRILIANSRKSYKDVAAALGISAPALSQKLGGDTNLTLDSILSIAQTVGADFDIVFRQDGARHAFQPWEREELEANILVTRAKLKEKLTEAEGHCDLALHMLRTVTAINRSAFRQAHTPRKAANNAIYQSDWSENNDAPVARKA